VEDLYNFKMQKLKLKDKKGGVVQSTVMGVGMLIIMTIIALVIVQTLTGASLLTSGGDEDDAVGNLTSNFTAGIGEISGKLPTILLIVAVVFLFGALVLLVTQARRMGVGSGGGSL